MNHQDYLSQIADSNNAIKHLCSIIESTSPLAMTQIYTIEICLSYCADLLNNPIIQTAIEQIRANEELNHEINLLKHRLLQLEDNTEDKLSNLENRLDETEDKLNTQGTK